MTARGRKPSARAVATAASRLAGSRLKVFGWTSTNTGVAPSRATTSAVAAKVKSGQNTASPGPIAHAISTSTQRIGAAGTADGVARAAEGGELRLEFADFRSVDELAMGEHARDRLVDGAAEPAPLRGDVDERDRRGMEAMRPVHAGNRST